MWFGKWCSENLEKSLEEWWVKKESSDLSLVESKDLLSLAVELLLSFVQQNFTGPFCELTELEGFANEIQHHVGDPFIELKENGEEINPNVVLGEFLIISRDILKKLLLCHSDSVVSITFSLSVQICQYFFVGFALVAFALYMHPPTCH